MANFLQWDSCNDKKSFITPNDADVAATVMTVAGEYSSAWQVARALSDERRDYIASLMKNSLTTEQTKHIRWKHLLSILGELNDIEILLLKLHSFLSVADQGKFFEQHQETLHPPIATSSSSDEEVAEAAIHESYLAHLKRMQLLEDAKNGVRITSLGRLLLRRIDQFASS